MPESWAEKWELIKQDVKIGAIARSTTLRRLQRAAEGKLRTNLNQLLALESEKPGLFCDDIAAIKSKLEAIDKVRYQGASVRARSERLLAGETPPKRALGDERKYAQRNEIKEIIFRGTLTRECKNIERSFVDHYEKPFGHCSPRIEEFKRDFLPLIPRLEDEARESLEQPISLNEVKKAIHELQVGKTTGPDGINSEFCKVFRDRVAPIL